MATPNTTLQSVLNHYPVDPETGEVGEETIGELVGGVIEGGYKAPRVRHRIRRFVLLNPDPLAEIALSATETRVLFAIIGQIPAGAGIMAGASTPMLAELLDLHASAISRAVRSLIEKQMLRRLGRGTYQVSPWIAFNGEMAEWKKCVVDWPKPSADSKES